MFPLGWIRKRGIVSSGSVMEILKCTLLMQKPKLYQKDEGYTISIVEENNGICLHNSNNGKCCYIGLVFKNPGEQYA